MKRNYIVSLLLVIGNLIGMDAPQADTCARVTLPLLEELNFSSPYSASYTPDGNNLVIGTTDCKFGIWNTHDLSQEPLTVNVPDTAHPIAMRPDSKQMAIGSVFVPATLWDIATGENVQKLPDATNTSWSLQYNNAGTLVLFSTEQGCGIVDLKSNQVVKNLSSLTVNSAQWDPTNNDLVAFSSQELSGTYSLSIVDVGTAKAVTTMASPVPLHQVAYTKGNKELCCSAPWQFATYDTNTAALIAYYNRFGKKIEKPIRYRKNKADRSADTFQFVPSMESTFIAGMDTGKILVCDLADESNSFCVDLAPEGDDIYALAISPDGKTVAAGLMTHDKIQIRDLSNLKGNTKTLLTDEEFIARARAKREEEKRQTNNGYKVPPLTAPETRGNKCLLQ